MINDRLRKSEEFDVDELPRPVTLAPRQMLEEREDVNVLAPLVRCSKCKVASRSDAAIGPEC
jgi:hypothetical protein